MYKQHSQYVRINTLCKHFLRFISFTNFNAQFLYSLSLLSSGILYSRLQRVPIPDAVIIQFVLLKMGMLLLETCRRL